MDPDEVAHYKELREAYSASAERGLVVDFMMAAKTYRVFLGNEAELRTLLIRTSEYDVALKLWDINNRPAFEAFLDEVDRLLHNYLAAVGSLRDHTRRLWRAYLPDDGEYAERARATFADSGLCVFVQNLRNFALHTNLPITQGRMSWRGQGSPLKTGVELNRTDLLRWKNWPAPAKRYLAELSDDGVDLQEIVARYTETVLDFNNWFGETFVERREEAFRQVRAMEDELNALLPGSFRPRPGAESPH